MDPTKTKTHFGYEEVAIHEKQDRVKAVFDRVAPKYDLMNDAMSLGIHRLWKKTVIHLAKLKPGMRVLDVATGSADLALKIAPLILPNGELVISDINAAMLQVGYDRFIDAGYVNQVQAVLANAESLPFQSNYFDRIFIGFGLRNVTNKEEALASMYRVLKPGGQLFVLEFSKPTNEILAKMYDQYSFKIVPKLGKLLANDEASYQYLIESIRMHPAQDELSQMFVAAGFDECDYFNFSGGVVAVHRGTKF